MRISGSHIAAGLMMGLFVAGFALAEPTGEANSLWAWSGFETS